MSPNDLGPTVVAVSWAFAAISTIIVIARFYVRLRIVRFLTIDDYIIAVTLALALGNSAFLTISTSWGLGQHIEALKSQPTHKMYAIKWVYLSEFFSILSSGFGRISFAFLLLGLMPPKKIQRRFLWAIICVQFVVDIGTVIIGLAQCQPLNGYWDPNVGASCWPRAVQQYAGYFQSSVCCLVDFVLALFPTSLFWNLKMGLKQKFPLSFMMGLCIFAMVASMVRAIYLRSLAETYDATYAMARLAIWWTLEAYLVLLAVSIPTLRPILRNPGDFIRNDGVPSTTINTFGSKRHQASSNLEDHNHFERLHELAFAVESSRHVELQPSGTHGYAIGQNNTADAGFREENGIRKNITVSVTYEESSEPYGVKSQVSSNFDPRDPH
ncbi:hypothetical protein F4805DRAFT_476876 [Annulohypoxylon moriforme]|nr:hypothetical protein F4805DRAFT_476876 [Annulohypoxylon moriforme]